MNTKNARRLTGNIKRKFIPPDLLRIELEKTERAGRIGEQTGLFYVPRIMGFNEKENFIDFEYLDELYTIQEVTFFNHPHILNIYTQIGAALAVIHDHLVLPPEMKMPLPDKWILSTEDNVFIHGDLTGTNVCYQKATDRLVILDWSTARFVGEQSTFGSRYFDITWFIYFLFYFLPAKFILRWNAKGMADAFVEGYLGNSRAGLELDMFRRFHLESEKLIREKVWAEGNNRSWYNRIGYYGLWLWKSYRYRRYKPRSLIKPSET